MSVPLSKAFILLRRVAVLAWSLLLPLSGAAQLFQLAERAQQNFAHPFQPLMSGELASHSAKRLFY